MQRKTTLLLVLLLSLVLVVTLGSASASLADPGQPTTANVTPAQGKAGYMGSAVCQGCHADIYDSLQDTLHPWKVRPKDEANIVGQFPVEMDGVTYTLDDVDWVIGAHPKWKQRYIDIDAEGN